MAAPPPNRIFVITLVVVLGITSALILLPFASFVIVGLLAVYFMSPPYQRLVKRWGWPRLTAGLFLLLLFVFVVAPFVYVGYVLVRESSLLLATLDPATTRAAVQGVVERVFGTAGVAPPEFLLAVDPGSVVVPIQQWVRAHLSDLLIFAARAFVGIVVLAFVVYYGLIDGPRLVSYLKSTLPLTAAHTNHLLSEIRKVVEAVFLGQLVAAASQATLALVGFLIFGLPHPFFWAFVVAILAIIPFVGSVVVWGPAVLYLLFTAAPWQGIGLLLWSLVLVTNVDNVVKPYVIGSRTVLHPVLVLIGIIGGLLLFGPVGFIVGPLVLSLFVAVLNFWRDDYLPHYRGA